jgi:enhancer of polycomb-like protein
MLQQDKADLIRPKRKYEKKPKVLPPSAAAPQQQSPAALPGFSAKDLNQYDFPSSDEEPLSQVNRRPAICTRKRNVGTAF